MALSVESHYRSGGLGSLVAEVIAENGCDCRLIRAAVADMPIGKSGAQAYMEREAGLDADSLVASITAALDVARI